MFKSNFRKVVGVASLMVLSGFTTQAFAAASGSNFGIGGNIGYSLASTTGLSQSGVGFGGELMYSLDPNFQVAANFAMEPWSQTVSGLSLNFNVMLFLAEINYHLSGDLSPFYIGVAAGAGVYTIAIAVSGVSASSSTTNFAAGGQAGYDIALMSGLTIGPKVSFDFVTTSGSTLTVFQGLASIRYMF